MTEQLQMAHVAPGLLEPNPWNTNQISDPANEEKLSQSMKRLGVFRPIVVRTLPSGQLQILGGEHRWKLAVKEGRKTVPIVNVGYVDDQRAKEIGLVDNARYGEDDALGLAGLLRELGDGVLDIMPFSQTELDSLLNTTNISLEDLDSVDSGAELPDPNKQAAPSSQLMRFKVPVEDVGWASKLIDGAMKSQGFKDEDALSNAGHALLWLLKRAEKSL
jgi:ParB family chromosome partitioning protein